MSTKTELNISTGVARFLLPSEHVVASLIASVRGHQQRAAGGVAGMVGAGRAGRARRDAEAAGITLPSPMALVLTPERMITVELGNGGRVKRLLDAFDLTEVGPIEVRRLGLGASLGLQLRGTSVRLESRVGAARTFAAVLARTLAEQGRAA